MDLFKQDATEGLGAKYTAHQEVKRRQYWYLVWRVHSNYALVHIAPTLTDHIQDCISGCLKSSIACVCTSVPLTHSTSIVCSEQYHFLFSTTEIIKLACGFNEPCFLNYSWKNIRMWANPCLDRAHQIL